MTPNNEQPAGLEPFAIPLETAQKYAENWIDADPSKPGISPTDMRAFLVRKKEFIEILTQYDTEFIRMYVGRKPIVGNPDQTLQPCLVLVSAARRGDVEPDVKDKNPDDIIDLIGTMETGKQFAEENYYVFDFSTLCPPECDTESPLFVGEADDRCQPVRPVL